MDFSAFGELDTSIKVLGFQGPGWKNWGDEDIEMIDLVKQKPQKLSQLRFNTPGNARMPNTSHRVQRLNYNKQGLLETDFHR